MKTEDKNLLMKAKKIDNSLSYSIGYRNLPNIVVVAIGFYLYAIGNITQEVTLAGAVILCMGILFWFRQFYENMDTIAVNEIISADKDTKNGDTPK